MLYRDISRTLAFYVWILILPLLFPTAIAIYCEWIAEPGTYIQPPASLAFLATLGLTFFLGCFFWWFGRKSIDSLYRKEALLLVVIVYFLTPAIGALPFYLNGTFSKPLDAYFEAVSGYTTTGASLIEAKRYDPVTDNEIPITKTIVTGEETPYYYFGTITPIRDSETQKIILSGVEALSPALVFWRSMMQWLGGVGIIVLFVAILPALGVGGKVLYQTEVTGPTKESMLPRIKETANQLWKIYLSLTLVEILLLMTTNSQMPLFDAITISFSTLSTGGFAPRTGSIAIYQNFWTDWVVIIFMIFGSVNFSIYFFCMRGKFSRLNDSEMKAFLAIILLASAFATWQLSGERKELLIPSNSLEGTYSFTQALTAGTFQIISAQTSTGFSVANYDLWPFPIQVLMLILFFAGGMAGSTAGGIKVIRLQTSFRIMLNKIESIFRPDTIREYRVGTAIISSQTAMTVLCFFMVVASLAIVGTFLLVLDGIDPETSLTTIGCMMNNVGLSFRMAGPTESFAFLPTFGKIVSCLWMIAGRLEYFALLMIFVPAFWKSA